MKTFYKLSKIYASQLDSKYHEYDNINQWSSPSITFNQRNMVISAKTVGTLGTYHVSITVLDDGHCLFTCDCPSLRTKVKKNGVGASCKHGAGLAYIYAEDPKLFSIIDMNDTNTLISSKSQTELIEIIYTSLQSDELSKDIILSTIRTIKDKKSRSKKPKITTKNDTTNSDEIKSPLSPKTPKTPKIEKLPKIPKKSPSSINSSPTSYGSQSFNSSPNSFHDTQDYMAYFQSQLSQDSQIQSPKIDSSSPKSIKGPNLNFLNFLENKNKMDSQQGSSSPVIITETNVKLENIINSQSSTQEYLDQVQDVKQEKIENEK